MSKQKIDKFYISDDDRFLNEFDRDNPQKVPAQTAEIEKHARIARLRDNADAQDDSKTVI